MACCFRVSKKDTPAYARLFEATARFIAACNPEAIAALLDALKARDAEIERLRGALSAILSDSLDADSETNVSAALYAQGVAAIDQARATGGEKANG
ncbi:hypothetical protein D3C86_1395330 [compost metagenome]